MECPCQNCIVKPMCRQKEFSKFKYCHEILIFLGFEANQNCNFPMDTKLHMKNYPKFYKILNPVQWNYSHWPKGHERYKKDFMINDKL